MLNPEPNKTILRSKLKLLPVWCFWYSLTTCSAIQTRNESNLARHRTKKNPKNRPLGTHRLNMATSKLFFHRLHFFSLN